MSGCLRRLQCALVALAAAGAGGAAEPAPAVAQSGPGRFEVSARDPTVAHAVTAAAEEAWRTLAVPLALPDGFPSPVFVRVSTESDTARAPFHVTVEPGGVVSLRMQWTGTLTPAARRGLVQALLLRLAVAHHGVNARLTVPLWLEQGCVGLWQTRADAAQLDAARQAAQGIAPPALATLFAWQRGGDEPARQAQRLEPAARPDPLAIGSLWLVMVLQAESGRGREAWSLLLRVLGGEPADAVLNSTFAEKFGNADERELWWQTAWHQAVRARTLPALEAADSRAQLAALARFVFLAPLEDGDVVAPLHEVLARAGEPVIAAELQRRAADLARLIPALHPFYRNAGLSLAAAFSARANSEPLRAGLAASFEADWRDAQELEAASTAALDALENKASVSPTPR